MIKKAFSLIELIVVMTVFSILVYIGFMSYSKIIVKSTDGKVVSQTHLLGDSIDLVLAKGNNFNVPENHLFVSLDGDNNFYQFSLNEEVLNNLNFINTLSEKKNLSDLTVSLSFQKDKYSILSYLEDNSNSPKKIDIKKLNENDRNPYVYGSLDIGIIVDKNLEPLNKTMTGTLNLSCLDSNNYSLVFSNGNVLPLGLQSINEKLPCYVDPGLSCKEAPLYKNAIFHAGNPTQINQDWIKGNNSQSCSYECLPGFSGLFCEKQSQLAEVGGDHNNVVVGDLLGSQVGKIGDMELEYRGLVNGDIIELPFKGNVSIVKIDWGDDGVNGCPTTAIGPVFCEYNDASKSDYVINIFGTSTGFGSTNTRGISKLHSVISWDSIGIVDFSHAFRNAVNLVSVPNYLPSRPTNLSAMFLGATSFNSPINNWDTSNVIFMSELFAGATSFNQNINSWDISKVSRLNGIFYGATSFNQPLDNWDTSNVRSLQGAFAYARSFNQNINSWNTSKVDSLHTTFLYATSFNQPLDNWDTSMVYSSRGTFAYASSFNQNINTWDMSRSVELDGFFSNATSFNQPLDNWTNLRGTAWSMFNNATSFNQNINTWDVSKVSNFWSMFAGATSFNQPLDNWNMSNARDLSGMFRNATSFNQNINTWETYNAINMHGMFWNATSFNQPLDNWNTSNVTNMSWMFNNATSFNQNLNTWDVRKVVNTQSMFGNATSFNGYINDWNLSSVTNISHMFNTARAFNQPLNNWNTSSVITMQQLFANTSSFNQPIGNWNTSNVISMDSMFSGATSFNQDLTCWNVAKVNTGGSFNVNFNWNSGLRSENIPKWGTTGCN